MNYSLNSGQNKVIEVCKRYMGDDDTVFIDCINTEMINLGNKPHRNSLDETLDKFVPDYYIHHVLVYSLDATSRDSVSDNVKKYAIQGILATNYLTGIKVAFKIVGRSSKE